MTHTLIANALHRYTNAARNAARKLWYSNRSARATSFRAHERTGAHDRTGLSVSPQDRPPTLPWARRGAGPPPPLARRRQIEIAFYPLLHNTTTTLYTPTRSSVRKRLSTHSEAAAAKAYQP